MLTASYLSATCCPIVDFPTDTFIVSRLGAHALRFWVAAKEFNSSYQDMDVHEIMGFANHGNLIQVPKLPLRLWSIGASR